MADDAEALGAEFARRVARAVGRALVAELLTAGEAAVLLGYTKSGFAAARRTPGFPRPVAVPGCRRPKFRRGDLLRWVANRQPPKRKRELVRIEESEFSNAGGPLPARRPSPGGP